MRTLNSEQARQGDEKHLCPLQFDIVDRLIERYSMRGELVFDAFAGLMTVPYRALLGRRRGLGIELNAGYFRDGVRHLRAAEREIATPSLFDAMRSEEGSMTDGPWTPELVADLARLWGETDLSTAEIARRLGVSKNAAVGKAHRIGLPGRPDPIDRRAAALAQEAAAQRAAGAGCRFIEGDDYLEVIAAGGDPHCGAPPLAPSGPWCAKHHAVVYTKRGSRRYFEDTASELDLREHQRTVYVEKRLGGWSHDRAYAKAMAA